VIRLRWFRQKLTADQDIARIHNDGNAWSWNHLATVVAGDDPALALANFLADYWNRQNQYMLIKLTEGRVLSGFDGRQPVGNSQ